MKKTRFYLIFLFLMMVLSGCDHTQLLLKRNEKTLQINTQIDPTLFIDNYSELDIDQLTINTSKFDTSKLGKTSITYTYKNHDIIKKLEIVDEVPPIVGFKDIEVHVQQEAKLEDFITEIRDDTKTTSSFKGNPDLTRYGTQNLIIKVVDEANNKTEVPVVFTRIPDTQAPTISGLDDITQEVDTTVDLLKDVTILDDYDSNPTVDYDDSKVNYRVPGQYEITYTVRDCYGNTNTTNRTIKIGNKNNRVVNLTFDDGPTNITPQILDILDKYQVKATFFVIKTEDGYDRYIKEAYDRGHTIGLHTYTHVYKDVYASKEAYFKDLQKIDDHVFDLTGHRSKILRFPGGSGNRVSIKACPGIMSVLTKEVLEKGYHFFDWNTVNRDADGTHKSVDEMVESACRNDVDHVNLLCHDGYGKKQTVEALPRIIEYYLENGYTFEGIKEDSPGYHQIVKN